jgi:hypothetical protein
MKTFIIKSILFAVPVVLLSAGVLSMEGGYSDAYYLRFTSPTQSSLIIGDSRSAQGLVPRVFNDSLKGMYCHEVFNYSFTLTESSYGSVYLKSIKQKTDTTEGGGLFIVNVDPWSISVASSAPNDERSFPEAQSFLAQLSSVSSSPNLDYILNHYPLPYYNIVLRRIKPDRLLLHEDGWLEVRVAMNLKAVNDRRKKQLKEYKKRQDTFQFSQARFESLQQTIEWLSKYGDVYLVRLPVDDSIFQLEEFFMPDFNQKIRDMADRLNVRYADYTPRRSEYTFTDGAHLHTSSAILVSTEISQWIKRSKNKQTSITVRSK